VGKIVTVEFNLRKLLPPKYTEQSDEFRLPQLNGERIGTNGGRILCQAATKQVRRNNTSQVSSHRKPAFWASSQKSGDKSACLPSGRAITPELPVLLEQSRSVLSAGLGKTGGQVQRFVREARLKNDERLVPSH